MTRERGPERPGERADGRARRQAVSDLRVLKFIGVVLPIVFLVIIESVRSVTIESDPVQRAQHVTLALATAAGVVAFAFLIFALIERAQRQIVRQNRELAAVNAVSTAVQGELGVAEIIEAALAAVADATGATDASVTVFPRDDDRETGFERKLSRAPHALPDGSADATPHLIDIPLASGTKVLGRMLLHLPPGVPEPDLLGSATLQNIGHQLADAVQIGQLVADLQRRKLEGHGLYDVLLRISNQDRLDETLGAVARHARERLGADAAAIRLNPATAAEVLLGGAIGADPSGLRVDADGAIAISVTSGPDGTSLVSSGDAALVAATGSSAESRDVQLGSRDAAYGSLWIGRERAPGFTGRDAGYLATLGGLASIAIAGAIHREREHDAAIVAERERIAREMHDSLAQVLGVTRLRLLALRPKADALEAGAGATFASAIGAAGSTNGARAVAAGSIAREIDELAELTEEAYRDVREAILGLREGSRSDRGLLEGLRAYLEKYARQAGIEATLVSTLESDPSLSPRAEIQVIRVIQEALTNVRKHSGASAAVVRVENGGDQLTFTVDDNGRGFDPTGRLLDRDGGYGLHTMRERLELVGGTLTIETTPGSGTRIIARVPTVPSAAPNLQNVGV